MQLFFSYQSSFQSVIGLSVQGRQFSVSAAVRNLVRKFQILFCGFILPAAVRITVRIMRLCRFHSAAVRDSGFLLRGFSMAAVRSFLQEPLFSGFLPAAHFIAAAAVFVSGALGAAGKEEKQETQN